MHPHLRENVEAAARFIAEARAVAQLRHQGIVEIFDVSDESDDERFLVAELGAGAVAPQDSQEISRTFRLSSGRALAPCCATRWHTPTTRGLFIAM